MSVSTLIPVPSDDVTASALAPRLRSLEGATVGILFNAKTHADTLLAMIGELLREQFPVKAVLPPERTQGVYHPSPEQLDRLASKADLILIGLGDCGSCSACSVQVATQFERLGVPAAAICTKPFLNAGRAMAARQGMRNYELVTLEHPLSSLTREELRERARDALPQVLAILCAREAVDLRAREAALIGR